MERESAAPVCKSLSGYIFSLLLGKYLGLGLPGHRANVCSHLYETDQVFTRHLYPHQKSTRMLVSPHPFGQSLLSVVLDFYHSNGFHSHFPDN